MPRCLHSGWIMRSYDALQIPVAICYSTERKKIRLGKARLGYILGFANPD